MSMKLQRFDMQHLRDFRTPIAVNAAALGDTGLTAAPLPPPPSYNDSDLDHARDAAKKIGYAEGFEAGIQQGNTEAAARERDLVHALDRIADQLTRLIDQYQQLINQQSAELSELVLLIARKVAGDALQAHGAAAITSLVERCLPMIFTKPRVTIELSPQMVDEIAPLIRQQVERSGFEGELNFRAEPSLEAHDIRIDWTQGQASRSLSSLWQEIEALLASVPLTPTLPATTPLLEQ